MTIGVSMVHFVIIVPKLVQLIVTILYRVQFLLSTDCQSKMTAKKTKWPPRNLFFDISTSDGDFPRIIVIALLYLFSILVTPLKLELEF